MKWVPIWLPSVFAVAAASNTAAQITALKSRAHPFPIHRNHLAFSVGSIIGGV
jgi:hypothetical protein